MSNETQAMPAPGTYFATNNGTTYDPLAEVTAYAAMDIKHEIWRAESDVQKAIQVQTNLINTNNLNLHNRLCDSEKAAIEAKFEAIIAAKDNTIAVQNTVRDGIEKLTDKIDNFQEETIEKLTDFERRTDNQFCELKERELQEQVSSLKSQIGTLQADNQSKSIVASVLDALSTKK